jgi:hypothetical protein
MSNLKLLTFVLLTNALLLGFILPVFATNYDPGIVEGQYVKYGNFIGNGPGAEAFNDYNWLILQVTDVSGKSVTLLSNSQYRNGTAIPGNGSIAVWNIETGTENGFPRTQGPIIATNLNQGDPIPPSNTYAINRTENRKYLDSNREVNILDVSFSTPDYDTTLFYVYDKVTGILLESTTQTTTQAQPQPIITTISYSIIETNIFSSTPTPSLNIPEFFFQAIAVILVVVLLIAVSLIIIRKKRTQK